MTIERSRMAIEAAEAPEAVARLFRTNRSAFRDLGRMLREQRPTMVAMCARGSSDHAATFGKYVIETLCATPVSSFAPSIASIYRAGPAKNAARRAVCIAVSQSGRSPDLLSSIAAWKQGGATTVALVNDENSPLAEQADIVLPLCAGPETSVAATKSFIASLSALAAIAAAWADDTELQEALERLPDLLSEARSDDWSAAVPALRNAGNMFVVGRGYGFGTACEAALKLKETCALHAEAFSSAEVRHGPMTLVGEAFPILAFAGSDEGGADVRALAAEFGARGANMLLADASGKPTPGTILLPTRTAHPALEPIVQIHSFYTLAERLSVARGLDPDTPAFLKKVTQTV